MKNCSFLLLVFLFFLNSCEKTAVEYEENLGFFEGTINGYNIISGNTSNRYEPSVSFRNLGFDINCQNEKGKLTLKFISKPTEPALDLVFTIDNLDKIKGKKYENFHTWESYRPYCQTLFTDVYQIFWASNYWDEKFNYQHLPLKGNYIKIENVKEVEYSVPLNHKKKFYLQVEGHFKIQLIRKEFAAKGIETFDSHILPDIMNVECKKFVAVIRS